MSITSVKEFFKQYNMEKNIIELDTSSATVELAAEALSVIPARIAKTLSFLNEGGCILIVTAGDGKIDNSKFKAEFGIKAKMLSGDDILTLTGHEAGGVCPFANPSSAKVFTDISMKRFETLFPACGSNNSAIELTCDEIYKYSNSIKWVDVCKNWE